MHLQTSALSEIPIYEQIKQQIKEQIFDGTLESGIQLPSIRMLAKELKVGIITVKRAYDDLCGEGLLISRQGKGIFVAEINKEQVSKVHEQIIFEQLKEVSALAKQYSFDKDKFVSLSEKAYNNSTEDKTDDDK